MTEMRALVDEACRQGFRRHPRAERHVKLFAPDGRSVVTLPKTPSDRRSVLNSIALLRRYGFHWKGR